MVKRVANSKLKGVLASYGVTHEMLATQINKTRQAVSSKLEKESFNQKEMLLIVDYLKNVVDENIDMNIFA